MPLRAPPRKVNPDRLLVELEQAKLIRTVHTRHLTLPELRRLRAALLEQARQIRLSLKERGMTSDQTELNYRLRGTARLRKRQLSDRLAELNGNNKIVKAEIDARSDEIAATRAAQREALMTRREASDARRQAERARKERAATTQQTAKSETAQARTAKAASELADPNSERSRALALLEAAIVKLRTAEIGPRAAVRLATAPTHTFESRRARILHSVLSLDEAAPEAQYRAAMRAAKYERGRPLPDAELLDELTRRAAQLRKRVPGARARRKDPARQ